MHATILELPPAELSNDKLERRILQHLHEDAVIGLDALIEMLPDYSWNQIFHAVDNLSRLGRIVLRRHRYDYTLFSKTYAA